jgi:hypothetical protein
VPLSSESSTHETVKAKFSPWFEPGFQVPVVKSFKGVRFSLGSGAKKSSDLATDVGRSPAK